MDALVTDAQSRAAVAGVRALGAAGLRALVVGPSHTAPALWSRHAAGRAIGPRPAEPGFLDRLAELALEYGPLVVHPAQEEALDPLVAGMERLPPQAVVPYPGPEALRRLRDKTELAELAALAGLPAPATLAQGTATQIASDRPPTPCVVKSTGRSRALPYTRPVDSDAELLALLARLPSEERFVVQERAGGPLIGLALVLDRGGAVVAQFQQVALRLWPVAAGGSTLAVSVRPDLELVERAAQVLRSTGFWGLAQMQFLTTAGGPALIDVNARYYGSMPLATAAGLNLPAIWQQVALGETLPPPPAYAADVRYRWLEGDLFAAARGHRRHLRRTGPRPASGAMWAANDPLASGLLAAQAGWAPVGRRLKRRR